MKAASALSFSLLFCVLSVACGSADDGSDASGGSESNLDTSGCSGMALSAERGPVQVSAARPPTSSCFNIGESGLSLTYSWRQTNDATPQKNNVGFFASLNGADTFGKADSYACAELPNEGFGHDTSGTRTFTCTARKRVDFAHAPQMKTAAYGPDGHRVAWNVQVAVALDDAGNWDSLDGANYRFSF